MAFPSVKAEMARTSITALELSKIVGVSESTFSSWMNGKTEPTISQCRIIAKVLGCSLDYLFAE